MLFYVFGLLWSPGVVVVVVVGAHGFLKVTLLVLMSPYRYVVVADGFLTVTLLCYSCLPNDKRTDPPLQEVFSSLEMEQQLLVCCVLCVV